MIPINKLVLTVYLMTFLSRVGAENTKVPCGGVYNPKYCEGASVDTLETVEDFERCAPSFLEPLVRDYFMGGSGRRITVQENQEAFKTIRIRKRVLKNLSNYNLDTTVLGDKISFPVGVSPLMGQVFVHPEGDNATAKGVAKMRSLMIVSEGSGIPLEHVASAVPSSTVLWMQANILPNMGDTISLVKRAEKSGYRALVVSVGGSAESSWKCNINNRFAKQLVLPKGLPNVKHPMDTVISYNHTFATLAWLKTMTSLPVVVKGVLTGEDAIQAVLAGASAIYVSNNGGRELDGTMPTIDALSEIVEAVHSLNPNIEIYLGGGVRNGFDVFKAVARGARAVFIGRPYIWGLTMGGENGVAKILTILRKEFKEAMLHAGFTSPLEITRNSIVPQTPNFACGSRYPL